MHVKSLGSARMLIAVILLLHPPISACHAVHHHLCTGPVCLSKAVQTCDRLTCAASAAVFGRTPMNLPVSSRTGMLAFFPAELWVGTDRLHMRQASHT